MGFDIRDRTYQAYKGLVIRNAGRHGIILGNTSHIKLINMGVVDSGRAPGVYNHQVANFYIVDSTQILVEGAYSWGHARYRIQFMNSSNSVVRRSVARPDVYLGQNPTGGLISYCSTNIVWQNNIVVDGNRNEFWTEFAHLAAVFGVPATGCSDVPEGIRHERSIGLNNALGLMDTDAGDNPNPTVWQDIVGWDTSLDRYEHGLEAHVPFLRAAGPSQTNLGTFGAIDADPGFDAVGGRAFFYSRSEPSRVTNSIIYRFGWDGSVSNDRGPLAWASAAPMELGYNAIFDFAGSLDGGGGAEDIHDSVDLDPMQEGLRYLPRIEAGSALAEAGEGGARIGAEVMTLIGKSGTFYGEPGYLDETGIPMWPFPHETLVRRFFADYSYTGIVRDGSTQTLSGERGFCAGEQSLTHYVWAYLGSTVPPFNVRAVADGTAVILFWEPVAAAARETVIGYNIYDVGAEEPTLLGTAAGAHAHTYRVDGLAGGRTYELAVTTVDANARESAYGYSVFVETQP